MSRATILAVMHDRSSPRLVVRLLAPTVLLVLIAAACGGAGRAPAATVDGRDISAGELNDVLLSSERARQGDVAAQSGGTLVGQTAIGAVPSTTTAVALTALIYDETVGDEVDPTGELAAAIGEDPIEYLNNLVLTMAGVGSIDDLEVSCGLAAFVETPEQMDELTANLPEFSAAGLQAVGASPLCVVRDDPRAPTQVIDLFWGAEIGGLEEPLPFEAFEATGFDGAPAPWPSGVALIAVVARGQVRDPEVQAMGQALGDLIQAWGQPVASTGQVELASRLSEIEVTVDPKYGSWNGAQVVDPSATRLQEEDQPSPTGP